MRKSNAKNIYYRPNDRPAARLVIWFTALGAILLLGSFILAIRVNSERQGRTVNVTKYLCSTSEPCDITVAVQYDTAPVDIVIVSPSGNRKTLSSLPTYEKDGKSVTASFPTDETGDWTVEYQPMSNRNIAFHTEQGLPSKLFISDVNIVSAPGSTSVSFQTDYGSDLEYTCLAKIRHGDDVYTVYENAFQLNAKTEINLSMSGVPAMTDAELAIFLYPSAGQGRDAAFSDDGMSFTDGSRSDLCSYIQDGFTYEITG